MCGRSRSRLATTPSFGPPIPFSTRSAHQLSESDTAILLVDANGRLVSRTFGGVRVERVLESVGAVSGAEFTEDAMGTTALGTPLEIRGGIVINAPDHFLEQFRAVSCYGRPILHPVSRRLEGIICMSNLEQTVNPLFAPFVDRIAGDIEQRLLDDPGLGRSRWSRPFSEWRRGVMWRWWRSATTCC